MVNVRNDRYIPDIHILFVPGTILAWPDVSEKKHAPSALKTGRGLFFQRAKVRIISIQKSLMG
jgi:hypothetical protein